MSDDEPFLARWSRRKSAAATRAPDPAKKASQQDTAPAAEPHAADVPPIDPASLPSLDSIGPGSDIRAFLAKGVPAALARAALRRAWTADPAIRDFIGLSENSWDFNASSGVPGFGEVSADDVRRLITGVFGEGPKTGDEKADTPEPPQNVVEGEKPPHAAVAKAADVALPMPESGNDQAPTEAEQSARPEAPRRHGGALPR